MTVTLRKNNVVVCFISVFTISFNTVLIHLLSEGVREHASVIFTNFVRLLLPDSLQ
jgi:hypothetical protein